MTNAFLKSDPDTLFCPNESSKWRFFFFFLVADKSLPRYYSRRYVTVEFQVEEYIRGASHSQNIIPSPRKTYDCVFHARIYFFFFFGTSVILMLEHSSWTTLELGARWLNWGSAAEYGSHDHTRAVAIGDASWEHTLSQPMSFHGQDAGPVRPSVLWVMAHDCWQRKHRGLSEKAMCCWGLILIPDHWGWSADLHSVQEDKAEWFCYFFPFPNQFSRDCTS